MKKLLYSFVLVIFFNLPLFAQTTYWGDDFNLNQGWTMEGNWSISGGLLQFYWSPEITNFDLEAVSPEITLLENTQELTVTQYLDVFGSSVPTEVAEISILAGGEYHILWEWDLSNDNWGDPTGTDIQFNISAFSGQTVRLVFRTYGPTTWQWNWWDIFNVSITAMLENDLTITGILGPTILDVSENGTWNVYVKNIGTLPQSDFAVSIMSYKYNDLIGSIDVTDVIEPGQQLNYVFNWSSPIGFNTVFYATVEKEGDDFEPNNKSKGHFVRIDPGINYSVFVWDSDNNIATIIDPEVGDEIQPSEAVTRALNTAGIDYSLGNFLPTDLSLYNIIFCTLGCYCVD